MPGRFKDWGHSLEGSTGDLCNGSPPAARPALPREQLVAAPHRPSPSEMTPVTFISNNPECLTQPATPILPASCSDVARR